jgi:hypothetical protein
MSLPAGRAPEWPADSRSLLQRQALGSGRGWVAGAGQLIAAVLEDAISYALVLAGTHKRRD